MPDFIYSQIDAQLQMSPFNLDMMDNALIRAALNKDIKRFKISPEGTAFPQGSPEYIAAELAFLNSIRSNKHEFFKRLFIELRGARQISLAVFFDNLDRRGKEIQEEAYLRASAIARDWASLVFVCLRPTTYYKSSWGGVLDSVAPHVIAVESGKSEFVLARRLKFAKRYAQGQPLPVDFTGNHVKSNASVNLPLAATVLECFVESFRGRKDLVTLFEAAANGNTRDMLKYVYRLLTSKFLDTREIADKFDADPTYKVPVHHAVRALLYGDSLHYDPKTCMFINLFDVQQADPLEHFTRLTTLNYLSTISDAHPAYGYVRVTEVVSYLIKVGYSANHALWTLAYLFDRHCIESRDPIVYCLSRIWKNASFGLA